MFKKLILYLYVNFRFFLTRLILSLHRIVKAATFKEEQN